MIAFGTVVTAKKKEFKLYLRLDANHHYSMVVTITNKLSGTHVTSMEEDLFDNKYSDL